MLHVALCKIYIFKVVSKTKQNVVKRLCITRQGRDNFYDSLYTVNITDNTKTEKLLIPGRYIKRFMYLKLPVCIVHFLEEYKNFYNSKVSHFKECRLNWKFIITQQVSLHSMNAHICFKDQVGFQWTKYQS